jgi:hypothetical protein
MLNEKSIKIGNAFHKYADSGDRSYIEQFSREDIENAIIQYGLEKVHHFTLRWNGGLTNSRRLRTNVNRSMKNGKIGFMGSHLLFWLG